MFKPTKLATIVAMVCTYHSVALANEKTNQLEEIQVLKIRQTPLLILL